MADNSILTPGYQDSSTSPVETPRNTQYLEKDNYLSEYASESERSVVRENLNVPSKDSVYNKQDVDLEVARRIREAIQEYLNMDDPHGIIPLVEEMIRSMVKTDGSTPFTAPQAGIEPVADNHLTTKRFVTRLLKEHINAEDPHQILPEVKDMLEKYVKTSEIYSKSQLYTKEEIHKRDEQLLKKDGTTPFTRPQVGADPTIDSHLTTKRYVDTLLHKHLIDVDPHGFITVLNQRLSSYIKKKDVFDKTQTYSRTQIDNIISQVVENAVQLSIQEYMDGINNKFEYIRNQRYVKQDGSIPFKNPQSGVDAVEDSELVTLRQLTKVVQETQKELDGKINSKECEWVTSGPSSVPIGNLEANSELPNTMTLQEVMDAIFYGRGITLSVPEYTNINTSCKVSMRIQGSLGMVEYAELFQDGKLVATFVKEDFENKTVIFNSDLIFNDTEFTFKVTYVNGTIHEETKVTKCSLPIFVGTLSKWKFANTVTYSYLEELCREDKVNNKFYSEGDNVQEITHTYNFSGKDLQHLFVVVPEKYPDLHQMRIPSQQFDIEAFDVINKIPLQISGTSKDVIYKMYIYRQAISSANQETIFKFKKQ